MPLCSIMYQIHRNSRESVIDFLKRTFQPHLSSHYTDTFQRKKVATCTHKPPFHNAFNISSKDKLFCLKFLLLLYIH